MSWHSSITAYDYESAALVRDGDIVAAVQEERFTQKKHDSRFSSDAIAYCLEEGRIVLISVDYLT